MSVSPGNGQSIQYDVQLTPRTKLRLKELFQEATAKGKGERFLAAFRTIINRLKEDPLGFGDPSYRLPALNMIVCRAGVPPIVVYYSVQEDRPVVLVRELKTLS